MAETQQQGANFLVELKIGGKVIDNKLINHIRITNSINSIYPIITFDMKIETGTIILQEMFGQTLIELSIALMGEDQQPSDITKVQLIYLESSLNLTPKNMKGSQSDQDFQSTLFTCIVFPCYKLVSTGINIAYSEPAGLTPLSCLTQTLVSAGISNSYIKADTRNINTAVINQILIPPMSAIRCVDYIHQNYGLFKGSFFRYCNINPASTGTPILIIKDLSQTIQDNPTIIIHQLPVDDTGGKREEIMNTCIDTINFYIDSPIATNNYTNSNIIAFRYNKVQIVHPEDTLFYNQPFTLDTVVAKYATSEKKQLNYLPDLKTIETKYCTDLKGFAYITPYSDAHITSRLSDQIKNTFQILVNLKHNLRITNLMQVGSTVQLKPIVQDYMKYGGKYILKNSDLRFTKVGENWECDCTLMMFRSSRDTA